MARTQRAYIRAYGVRLLLSRHPEVRKLKRFNTTTAHGNKLWTSSWLLIDYFERRGFLGGRRVMEVGCGWGLAGIYCAKKHGAVVTGVDIDPEVFPYLSLHSEINKVKIAIMKKGFAELTGKHLKEVDVMIGADICFWNTMVNPLKKLINRALDAGVRRVLIADPGRPPFEEMGEYFVNRQRGKIFEWATKRPRRVQGRILEIGSIEDCGFQI